MRSVRPEEMQPSCDLLETIAGLMPRVPGSAERGADRQFWLDRYSLDEIRVMASAFWPQG